MFPLLLMGALGAGIGVYENKIATEAADLEPKIMGVNAQTAGTIAGLAMMFVGGPMLAPLGLSLAVGSIVSKDAMGRAKAGLDNIVAEAVKRQMGGGGGGGAEQPPAPPALPGPVARGGNFLNMLRQGAEAFGPHREAEAA